VEFVFNGENSIREFAEVQIRVKANAREADSRCAQTSGDGRRHTAVPN